MTQPQPARIPAYETPEPGSIFFIDPPETGYTLDEIYNFLGPGPPVNDEGEIVVDDEMLTAAAIDSTTGDVHTGAMIALVPTIADAERFVLNGGEPLEQLHMTLIYLGEAADISSESRLQLLDSVSRWAKVQPSIIATAFSVNVFNPMGDEPCIVIGFGGDHLASYNDEAIEVAEGAGIDTSLSKRPWIPHVTLRYHDVSQGLIPYDVADLIELAEQRMGDVAFDRLRVTFGGEVHDFTLASIID
jgi:2'-5' RNA ligase